jgi:hypothetical protein
MKSAAAKPLNRCNIEELPTSLVIKGLIHFDQTEQKCEWSRPYNEAPRDPRLRPIAAIDRAIQHYMAEQLAYSAFLDAVSLHEQSDGLIIQNFVECGFGATVGHRCSPISRQMAVRTTFSKWLLSAGLITRVQVNEPLNQT